MTLVACTDRARIRRFNLPDTLELQTGKLLSNEIARYQQSMERLLQQNQEMATELRRSQTAEERLESENADLKAELLISKSEHS